MKKIVISTLLVAGLAVGSSATVFAYNNGDTSNNGSGAGYSMMGNGNSSGMGSGMMGGRYNSGSNRSGSAINPGMATGNNGSGNANSGSRYGMGPGIMGYGGYGYGMGPGMMGYGGYGYGMGPGMMGYGGCGYGMGPGMMGYFYGPNSGRAYGSMWNGWQQPEQMQKFLDATVELRRKLNDKLFDLHEALRKPSTTADTVAKLQKEILNLRNKISEKAGAQH